METSASFEARSAPLSYPTAKERTYGSVRGAVGNHCPYRNRFSERQRGTGGSFVSVHTRVAYILAFIYAPRRVTTAVTVAR